jgi:predicted ATP-grasp superfamily ATP-dependent carboligase
LTNKASFATLGKKIQIANKDTPMDLLLIAQSARMLAQSSTLGGFRALAIDWYADADTRRHTVRCIAVTPVAGGFDEAGLIAAVNDFAPAEGGCALVYGSGIDTRPILVEKLVRDRNLLGNAPPTLRRINQPRIFFRLLTQLSIPYPETRFAPPDRADGWLIKPSCGEGGRGVGFLTGNQHPATAAYYQRWAPGDAYSLLFLANRKEIRTIGWNTQKTAKHDPIQPFLFAGAVNRTELSAAHCLAVEEYAAKLTAEAGLAGLNSLDFVLVDGVAQVLEINPRPSASMALYDEDFAEGLLALHIAACHGELPPAARQTGPVRAFQIVYSPSVIEIPVGFEWPQGSADIPNPGTTISAGQPLCSLLVQDENRQKAEILIKSLENEILGGLDAICPSSPSIAVEIKDPSP